MLKHDRFFLRGVMCALDMIESSVAKGDTYGMAITAVRSSVARTKQDLLDEELARMAAGEAVPS